MILLTRNVIREQDLLAQAQHPECGAVLSFSGTVRNHHEGRKVIRLAYEAYEPMAQSELERVANEALLKWPDVRRVQLVHRLGEMDVGASSVFITVSSPHRVEGFATLRFLIDTLKQRVPIWKKEFYEDGETQWLHPDDGCCVVHDGQQQSE